MTARVLNGEPCKQNNRLEAEAREACDLLVGELLTDTAWAAMRARLLAFAATLRSWETANANGAPTR
jgi:hypothetical protein